jgi:hypothetical protein
MKKILVFALVLSCISTAVFAQRRSHRIGGDADAHGCRASAGYTWSQLKKECIRLFEQEIKLPDVNPKGSMQVIIIFSKDRKKAEAFIPSTKGSTILARSGRRGNYSWKNGDWALTDKNGYWLKKGKRLMYKS